MRVLQTACASVILVWSVVSAEGTARSRSLLAGFARVSVVAALGKGTSVSDYTQESGAPWLLRWFARTLDIAWLLPGSLPFARNLKLPAANIRDSKAAQRAGVCASKSEDLGSIPRTHGVSRESQLLQFVF